MMPPPPRPRTLKDVLYLLQVERARVFVLRGGALFMPEPSGTSQWQTYSIEVFTTQWRVPELTGNFARRLPDTHPGANPTVP